MSRIHEHVSNGARGLLQSTATRERDEKWVASSKRDNDCVSRSVAFHTDLIQRARAHAGACKCRGIIISRRALTHHEADLFASERDMNVYVIDLIDAYLLCCMPCSEATAQNHANLDRYECVECAK